ncbi:peptidyl-prolyl cis-trans isomerase [Candidatus Dependentiae bacterium]|nr:peptidyl-prolyl cis-trans isomerase [Candidatus Dependentiae bacterium]
MIGSMRKNVQKGNLKLIIWFVLLAMAGSSISLIYRMSQRSATGAADVATVNGLGISALEFRRRFIQVDSVISNIRRAYGPQADLILQLWHYDQKPEDIALNDLIQEKVVQSAADKLGIYVSPAYVESKLNDPLFVRQSLGSVVPAQVVENGTLNVTLLKTYLQRMGISETDFETLVQDTLARNLVQQLAQESLYIPQMAVKEQYAKEYLKKKFGLLSLNLDDYLKKIDTSKITEQELTAFYDAHKEQYRVPEKRTAQLWSFDPAQYDVVVTQKELQEYYDAHVSDYIDRQEEVTVKVLSFKEDKNKANEAAQRASKNAKEFDAQVASAQTLTLQRSDVKDRALTNAAFALAQTGDVSPVVYTKQGFVILKLVNRKPATYKPLSSVKEDIKKKATLDAFKRSFSVDGQRIINQAYDAPELFSKFIESKKAQKSTIENIAQDGTLKSQKIFGVAQEGGRVFYQEKDKGYIAELTKITPSFIPNLADIKQRVLEETKTEQARDLLEQDLKKIVAQKEGSLQERAKAAGISKVQFETTDFINSKSQDALKKLEDKHIPTSKLSILSRKGAMLYELADKAGFVYQVTETEPLDEKQYADTKARIEQQLRQQAQDGLGQSFVDTLKTKATVSVDQELLKRASGRTNN